MIDRLYYNRDGEPITQEEALFYWETIDRRRVGWDELPNGVQVSTVFLVMDHNWSSIDETPLLFETMVFGKNAVEDEYQERYATEEEAIAGHARILRRELANVSPFQHVLAKLKTLFYTIFPNTQETR